MTDIHIGAQLGLGHGGTLVSVKPKNMKQACSDAVHQENHRRQQHHESIDDSGVGKGNALRIHGGPVLRYDLSEQENEKR